MKLSDSDLELLKTNPGGIYCIALKDEVWQAQLAEFPDVDSINETHDPYSGEKPKDENLRGYPMCYIGRARSTTTIKTRISSHMSKLRHGYASKQIQQAFDTYGEAAFDVHVIETCSDDLLRKREDYWIRLFNAQGIHGYNICSTDSSHKGLKHEDGTLSKMATSQKIAGERRRQKRAIENPDSIGPDGKPIGKQQKQILDALTVNTEGMAVRELEALGLPKANVRTQLNNLKARGLVKDVGIKPVGNDNRQKLWVLEYGA